jgi:hypothetical protein
MSATRSSIRTMLGIPISSGCAGRLRYTTAERAATAPIASLLAIIVILTWESHN